MVWCSSVGQNGCMWVRVVLPVAVGNGHHVLIPALPHGGCIVDGTRDRDTDSISMEAVRDDILAGIFRDHTKMYVKRVSRM